MPSENKQSDQMNDSVDETRSQEEQKSEIIRELIERGDQTYLKTILMDMHPADIAEVIARIDRDKRNFILDLLKTEAAAEVLIELDTPILKEILSEIDEKRLVTIVSTMDSDDAADVIGELDEIVAQNVLAAMPTKEFREVKSLLRHDEETAGGIMALEIVAVDEDRTAQQAMGVLRKKAKEVEDVYNIYVIDKQGLFKGAVSLKELVLAKPKTKLVEIMDREHIAIRSDMDQEEVANLFLKYDLVAAPVIDAGGRLVGRITVDDVMDVVEEEASEDITMMAGITDEEIRGQSIFRISGVRLPWLLVAFLGEIASAAVLIHFQASFEQILVAGFFIPLIMAMGGNMGIQSSTIVIRGLATGDIALRDTGRRLVHEISAAFLNGSIIVLLLIAIVAIWNHWPIFGKIMDTSAFGMIWEIPVFSMVLGIALLTVLFNAAFIGTLLPLLFKRIGVDPAIATGPFITTSNDVMGLLVYFSIVSFAINRL